MNILVLNCGSSSLKFQVIATDSRLRQEGKECQLAGGIIERIGSQSLLNFHRSDGTSLKAAHPLKDHQAAIAAVVDWLFAKEGDTSANQSKGMQSGSSAPSVDRAADLHAIGHRVVHGGERFQGSIRIDDAVLKGIEECIDLAPLHNPANIGGILAARKIFGPKMPQVAVFDTAFHAMMPEKSFLYAIPYHYYRRHRIRRYGFHGSSHRYLMERYAEIEHRDVSQARIITLHLGNGCSAAAIEGGRSVATSMGMTPLEGMVMGTRCGDLDPAIIGLIGQVEGLGPDGLEDLLNKQSGLLGVSGITSDMRELLDEERENGDRRAKLAIDLFAQGVRKYIGSYLASMNGADAIVFAGGIGENSPAVRSRICKPLEWMGLKLDDGKNDQAVNGWEGMISAPGCRLQAYVIPTNEELVIARDAAAFL